MRDADHASRDASTGDALLLNGTPAKENDGFAEVEYDVAVAEEAVYPVYPVPLMPARIEAAFF